MAGKRSSRRRAKQSKNTGCLSGCLNAIFGLIGTLIGALVAIIAGLFQLLASIIKWLNQQKVTLPIGKGYQVSGLFIGLFLCSLCMCCSIGYVWADMQLRAIGILPTYTPHPTATHTLIPTGTSTPTEMPPPIDTLTPLPLPAETPLPTYTPVPSQPTAKVTAPALNVRAGPGTDYPAVGKLSQGDSVEVVGRNAAGDWLQIVYPADSDSRAWIATAYVELTGSLVTLPEVSAPPSPEPTSTSLPAPTIAIATSIPTDTPTSVMISAPTDTPIPPPPLPPPPPPPSSGCCKHCGPNSQPCGNSCISLKYTCHEGPGCACW